jgi:3-oxoacyl-[acyl-carrier protein] reductase
MGSRGITVNCVAPGIIESPMVAHAFDAAAIAALVPLQRAGKPEDVAAVVSFLASDAAAYITGQTIPVSGGLA